MPHFDISPPPQKTEIFQNRNPVLFMSASAVPG